MTRTKLSPSGVEIDGLEAGNYGLPYATRFNATSSVTTSLTTVGTNQYLTVPGLTNTGKKVKRNFTAHLSLSNGTGVTDVVLQSATAVPDGPWTTVDAVQSNEVSAVEGISLSSSEVVDVVPANTYYRLAVVGTEVGSQVVTATAAGNTSPVTITCVEFDY